jgi:hypothetical protein
LGIIILVDAKAKSNKKKNNEKKINIHHFEDNCFQDSIGAISFSGFSMSDAELHMDKEDACGLLLKMVST